MKNKILFEYQIQIRVKRWNVMELHNELFIQKGKN